MTQITNPKNVHYLALEGGGGKGVTYLGAIKALEKFGVLPIDIDRPDKNQIKGISGASAGAITGMFLAMGYTSAEIQNMLSNSSIFTGFFDDPFVGTVRSVDKKNRPTLKTEIPSGSSYRDIMRQRRSSILGFTLLINAVGYLARAGTFGNISNPIIKRLVSSPENYLNNILFDRGMFPGVAVRQFLQNSIYDQLWEKFVEKTTPPGEPKPIPRIDGSEINFRTFFELTGVDLVITGANISRHKPAVFSMRHTPDFPVAEAVGISMNLPFLFKPVHVEASVPVGQYNLGEDDYHGMWIDGGILNNFPLHAFDFLSPSISTKYPNLKPLNPNMLGLRLTEGPSDRVSSNKSSSFDVFFKHLSNVMGTVLYPSEEGQIRNQDEREQTIDLYTYDLETTEFAPPQSKSKTPIAEAEKAVLKYFS
ncbi:MAG: patatin-like phospholipase family protein [Cyanobacteria bacterium P01_G01_bin.19]